MAPNWRHSPRGANLAPRGATWRMRYFEFMLTLSPRGAILAPCGATWRHFGAMWRCEHNFTYHCTSPRGGVATWRQKMANLKFPFAILAPRGATWRHKFAKMAPLWRQNGAIVAIQRTRHFMAPRGAKCSPRGATVAPRGAILAPFRRHVAPQSAHDLKYYTTLMTD